MLQIFVDADACPVKDEIIRVAERHRLQVHIVSNSWMRLMDSPVINKVIVPEGPDEADDWIVENAQEGDIAITADIPLASRCLQNNVAVLGPTGRPFSEENIGMALAMRDLNAHLRETGEKKGNNPQFTKQDRSNFLQALELVIQRIKKDAKV